MPGGGGGGGLYWGGAGVSAGVSHGAEGTASNGLLAGGCGGSNPPEPGCGLLSPN